MSTPAPRAVAASVAALALLLALPTLAAAGTAEAGEPPDPCPVAHYRLNVTYDCVAEFTLPATDGYRVTVSGEPGSGSAPVEIDVSGHGGAATYDVPGKVTATAIRADFGRLGRIAVRFRPSGAERHVRLPKGCLGERPPVVGSRLGSFIGTIRFRGEGGYTELSARRAEGGLGDPLATTARRPDCRPPESGAERGRELEAVSLEGTPPRTGISFTATRLIGSPALLSLAPRTSLPPGERYFFFVFASGKSGRVSILRAAAAVGGSGNLVIDPTLTRAQVAPPYPFSGSAVFARDPDGTVSWTGTLGVALPGLGVVGLTGGKAELATVATHLQQAEAEGKAP
jgi:hypothetical protein